MELSEELREIMGNLKNLVFLVLVLLGAFGLNDKYSKYKETLKDGKLIVENKKNLEDKIDEILVEKAKNKEKMENDYEKIKMLIDRFGILSIKNESQFKKMVYIFSNESGLKLKEISKSEKLWDRKGYSLKYIHFTLSGSLNDFGKFLYLVNKSKKYIDTTRSYIELTQEAYKISLGYIENTTK